MSDRTITCNICLWTFTGDVGYCIREGAMHDSEHWDPEAETALGEETE